LIKRDLIQGSAEWTAWRLSGLGASELAELLDESPYGDPKKLLARKMGKAEEKKNQYILDKGHDIETKVRAKYQMKSDGEFPPVCAELDELPFFRASFDGLGAFPLEIKYCGEKNLNVVNKHHWVQIQGQLAVAGADRMLLIKSHNGVDTAEIWVERVEWFWKRALVEIKKFEKKLKK
jgi:putative phage-type endonuclease